MLIAALFTITKKVKSTKCSSVDYWENKRRYMHINKYCLAIKRNKAKKKEQLWLPSWWWSRLRACWGEGGAQSPCHVLLLIDPNCLWRNDLTFWEIVELLNNGHEWYRGAEMMGPSVQQWLYNHKWPRPFTPLYLTNITMCRDMKKKTLRNNAIEPWETLDEGVLSSFGQQGGTGPYQANQQVPFWNLIINRASVTENGRRTFCPVAALTFPNVGFQPFPWWAPLPSFNRGICCLQPRNANQYHGCYVGWCVFGYRCVPLCIIVFCVTKVPNTLLYLWKLKPFLALSFSFPFCPSDS